MRSIFSVELFVVFPFCAAEDACNDEGGEAAQADGAGRCFFLFFLWRKAAQEVGSVSATLGKKKTATEQHQRGKLSFWDLLPK